MKLIKCRICKKKIPYDAKKCPHCQASMPGISNLWNILIIGVSGLIFAFIFTHVEPQQPPETGKLFTLTEEGIKTLSSNITSATLTPSLIDINISKNPVTGGAQDWNSIAMDAYTISRKLLENKSTQIIHFTFWSPNNNNLDWARIFIDRNNLPASFETLTYLQVFSFSKPLPGSIQAGQWLCDFYSKYKSSRPFGNGEIPEICNN